MPRSIRVRNHIILTLLGGKRHPEVLNRKIPISSAVHLVLVPNRKSRYHRSRSLSHQWTRSLSHHFVMHPNRMTPIHRLVILTGFRENCDDRKRETPHFLTLDTQAIQIPCQEVRFWDPNAFSGGAWMSRVTSILTNTTGMESAFFMKIGLLILPTETYGILVICM